VENPKTIKFYRTRDEYGFLSNFYKSPITLKGFEWRTSEHYFQAQKFAGTKYETKVRNCPSAMDAANMGRDRSLPLRGEWERVKDEVMYETVMAKFTQNTYLKEKLLETGDAELIENTKNDGYWGNKGDGTGKNMLGKILMKVREELQSNRGK
jgi:ribA/ribD-fused uncharacterized protein